MERKELKKKELQYGKTIFLQVGFIAVFLVVCMIFMPIKAQGIAQSSDTTIYRVGDVEEEPEFPGGKIARIVFIVQNLKYPNEARKEKLQGSVEVEFVVETDGSLTHFEVTESVHPILDEEALRVMKLMPKWAPGKHQGKTVRVRYDLTITFTEDGGDGNKYMEELNKK